MRERRASTEATEDSRDSKTANGRWQSPNRRSEATVEERLDLQWGSEDALSENSRRASGAQELSSARDIPKATTGARVLPPRPGNFPPIPKVNAWSSATKEALSPACDTLTPSSLRGFRSEPPGGSTRAYNQAELEQLLYAADRLTSSSLPPAPGDMAETRQLDATPPEAPGADEPMASWPPPVESLFPHVREATPTDEATTANLKPSSSGLLDETISLEDRQCWAAATPGQRSDEIPAKSVKSLDPAWAFASPLQAALAELHRHRMARRRLVRLQKRARLRNGRLVRGMVLLACLAFCGATWLASPLAEHSRARAAIHNTSARLSALLGAQRASLGVRSVQLDIAAEPPNAQLYLDGRQASNPLKLAYPADPKTHELLASAPGYRSRSLAIRFDRDVTIVLGLSPDAPEPKPLPQ